MALGAPSVTMRMKRPSYVHVYYLFGRTSELSSDDDAIYAAIDDGIERPTPAPPVSAGAFVCTGEMVLKCVHAVLPGRG